MFCPLLRQGGMVFSRPARLGSTIVSLGKARLCGAADGRPPERKRNFYLQLFSEMLLCAAIVNSVSASCVRTVPSRFSSSSVSLQAIALAAAVMEAVNSHAFKGSSPLSRYNMTESGFVFLFAPTRSGKARPPERAGGEKSSKERRRSLLLSF